MVLTVVDTYQGNGTFFHVMSDVMGAEVQTPKETPALASLTGTVGPAADSHRLWAKTVARGPVAT